MSNNTLPFLDIIITLNNGDLTTTVYRKKTHTDQYLNFHSCHPLEHKLSVVNTLVDRCEKVVTKKNEKLTEMKKIKQALVGCEYPNWSMDKIIQTRSEKGKQNVKQKTKDTTNKNKGNIGIPYIPRISERIRRCLSSYNVNTYFTPQNKLRSLLVHPKDKIKNDDKSGLIYHVNCNNCKKAYKGETARTLSTRIKEHKADVTSHCTGILTRSARNSASEIVHNSAITDHMTTHTHLTNWNVKILGTESSWKDRKIKESIKITKHGNTMNRDDGGLELPKLYNNLLKRRPQQSHLGKPERSIDGAIPYTRSNGNKSKSQRLTHD
ncbi:uncharacterized protein [Antedon mediterranea]|uniref:uncharacterized protein n=1 Tax=Antedon mediterranea TaxID=105859 RepID=UPI003AF98F9C